MYNSKYEGKALRGAKQTIRKLKRLPVELIAGQTVLDLGCNEGLVAEWLMRTGARRVIGFEPQPAAFAKAKAHARRCGFEVRQLAVMHKAGKLPLRTSVKDAAAGYYCNSAIDPDQQRRDHNYIEVRAVELARVLKELKPAGIKMDVEGSEWDMLLRTKLNPELKWICLEIHWIKTMGAYLFPALAQRLAEQGFGIQCWPLELKLVNGEPQSFQPFEVMNFVRGHKTSAQHERWLRALTKAGVRRHKRGRVTRLPTRQALMDFCYGARS